MAIISWTAGTGDWNTATNWSSGTVPTGADTAVVDDAGTAVIQNSTSDAVSVLNIGTSATGFVFAGSNFASPGTNTPGTLTVANAITVGAGGEAAVVDQASLITAASIINSGTVGGGGTMTAAIGNNHFIIADGEPSTFGSFGPLVMNGNIAGKGSIDIDGGGTLVLNGVDITNPIFPNAAFGFGTIGTTVLELGSALPQPARSISARVTSLICSWPGGQSPPLPQ
jgi:hypothetical protein